jgi:uncharacterized membrane protein YbjE (DUF340 family)
MSEAQRDWLTFLVLALAAGFSFGSWQNNVTAGLFMFVLLIFIVGCIMFNARLHGRVS